MSRNYSRRNKNRKKNQGPIPHSQATKKLSRDTGHGFSEFRNAEQMVKYYNTDPSGLGAEFEPPMFRGNKPTQQDLKRSRGE